VVRRAIFLTIAVGCAACGKTQKTEDSQPPAIVENNIAETAPVDPATIKPGEPGGLPDEPKSLAEGTIDPKSPQGAAQLVQGYYGLLEERRFSDAQKLWGDHGPYAEQDPAAFAARFAGFSEIHANIGAPGDGEGAAGSLYVSVPVQVYARIAATGKPWYALRSVTLRRVNDVDGSTAGQRSWHIDTIGPFPPVAPGK